MLALFHMKIGYFFHEFHPLHLLEEVLSDHQEIHQNLPCPLVFDKLKIVPTWGDILYKLLLVLHYMT